MNSPLNSPLNSPSIDLTDHQRQLLAERLADYGAKRAAGAAIGCSGQHINQILSGAKRPSRELLERLCKHLNLKLKISVTIQAKRRR